MKLFWMRRYLAVFAVAFAFIALVQVLRGRAIDVAVTHSLMWAAISAALFVGTQIYKWRKQEACAVCEAVGTPASNDGRDARS